MTFRQHMPPVFKILAIQETKISADDQEEDGTVYYTRLDSL